MRVRPRPRDVVQLIDRQADGNAARTFSPRARAKASCTALDNRWVHCYACGHNCRIPPGALGVCKVRFNEAAGCGAVGLRRRRAVRSRSRRSRSSTSIPGALAYSFGMLGCDLHCGYCQNWVTSQALRDPRGRRAAARRHARAARSATRCARGAQIVVSTYNEPLITSEWAVAVFEEARAAGADDRVRLQRQRHARVLDYLRPWIDAYKVDLKSFDDRHYRELGGRCSRSSTRSAAARRGRLARDRHAAHPRLQRRRRRAEAADGVRAGVSPDIPWHVTAFHGDYKMTEPRTRRRRCCCAPPRSAREAGLRYVYAGNLPGRVGRLGGHTLPALRRRSSSATAI